MGLYGDERFDEVVGMLAQLGLTPDEARIYTILLEHGGLTASEITLHMNIVVNSVYRLTAELKQKGLVKELDVRPKRFQAISPSIALAQLADQQIERIRQLREEATKALRTAQSPTRLNMQLLTGREELFEAFVEYSKKARHEILVISVGEPVPDSIWKVMEKAIKHGAEARFIFHRHDRDNIMLIKRWQAMGVVVRHLPMEGYHLNIFDQSAAILSASNPKQTKERTGTVFHNDAIVTSLRDYFYQQWVSAKPT